MSVNWQNPLRRKFLVMNIAEMTTLKTGADLAIAYMEEMIFLSASCEMDYLVDMRYLSMSHRVYIKCEAIPQETYNQWQTNKLFLAGKERCGRHFYALNKLMEKLADDKDWLTFLEYYKIFHGACITLYGATMLKHYVRPMFIRLIDSLLKFVLPLVHLHKRRGYLDDEMTLKIQQILIILNSPEHFPIQIIAKCTRALLAMEKFLILENGKLPEADETLYRQIHPHLTQLFPDICPPQKLPEYPPYLGIEVQMHLLKREVLCLNPKFEVKLNPIRMHHQLLVICSLNDKHLPAVPPLDIELPVKYPYVSPICTIHADDYKLTEFLRILHGNIILRLNTLPALHTLSHILNAWESAVRQSSVPNAKVALDFHYAFHALLKEN